MKNGIFSKAPIKSLFKYLTLNFVKKPSPSPCYNQIKLENTRILDDSFSWIKALNEKTSRYISDENRYADKYFNDRKNVKEIRGFFNKLLSDVNEDLNEKSEKYGTYLYSFKQVAKKQWPILFRYKDGGTLEEVVIDLDVFTYIKCPVLGEVRVSPDEQSVAVGIDLLGTGLYDCHLIKPAARSEDIVHLANLTSVSSYEWLCDDKLLYTKLNVETLRSSEFYIYTISTDSNELVYVEKDARYSMHTSKSRCGEKLFLNITSKLNSEVWLLGCDGHLQRKLCCRDENKDASIDHMRDVFYNLITDDCNEYCIKFEEANDTWKEFVSRPPNSSEFITDMVLYPNQLVLLTSNKLVPGLSIYPDFKKENCIDYRVSETPGHLEVETDTDDDVINVSFTSPTQPLTKYRIETKTRTITTCDSVLPSWKEDDFECKTIFINSKDDATVPVNLFYKSDVNLSAAPMLCRVYGSYGKSASLRFNPMNAYLLSRGWILMFAHVRGGQELGRNWYLSSRLQQKHKTFHDLEYALSAIHNKNISTCQNTALYGKSAGGLPVAWMINNRPDLFGAAVMEMPFISVLHTMLNEENQLTTQEYMEWGNPVENVDIFDYISSYCPYVNMQLSQRDPAVLVHTSLEDNVVPYWIPLQWVAKRRYLQDLESNSNVHGSKPLILCRIDTKSGHHSYNFEDTLQRDEETISFLERNITP